MFTAWKIQIGHKERLFHQEAEAALRQITQRGVISSIFGGVQRSVTQSHGWRSDLVLGVVLLSAGDRTGGLFQRFIIYVDS